MTAGETIDVGFAVDDAYTLPMAVAGRSIAENLMSRQELRIHVLELGISAQSKRRIADAWPDATAHFYPVPTDLLDELPLSELEHAKRLTSSVYGYLYLPVMLADICERVLVMDADTLTIADVSSLWSTPLEGAWFAAVQDPFVRLLSGSEGLPDHADPGADEAAKYCNSGVLLVDPSAWVENEVWDACLRYAARYETLPYADQDCLNAVTHGRWREIDTAWNFQVDQTCIASYQGPTPKILHYGGRHKPWTIGSQIRHYQLTYSAYLTLTSY